MDPYLVDIARRLPELDDPAAINDALDKLEFLFEALDPDQQDVASQLMERLRERLAGQG